MLYHVYSRKIMFDKMYVIIRPIIEYMNIYLQPIHGNMDRIQAYPKVIRALVINDNEIQHGQVYSRKPGFKLKHSYQKIKFETILSVWIQPIFNLEINQYS
jgi:hypothetical protein